MKRILSLLCAVLCIAVLLLPLSVSAVDEYDYEGELDPRTGKPISGGEEGEEEVLIEISNDVYYDTEEKAYIYTIGGQDIWTNLPAGALTNSRVSLIIPEGVDALLYRNGVQVAEPDFLKIVDEGAYVVMFSDIGEATLSFKIVSDLTSIPNGFQAPAGFRIISATLDDEPIQTTSYVDMSADGKYKIEYRCTPIDVTYTVITTVDHTPPTLALAAVKDGYASGPVSVADLESGTRLSVTLNGAPLKVGNDRKLTKSGLYNLTLTDKAGNVNSYSFVIRVYFNFNSYVFAALLVVIGIFIWLYLRKVRKNLRIR